MKRILIIRAHYLKKAIDRLQPLSILRGMDWCHPQNNDPTHTTVAKFQALIIWNP